MQLDFGCALYACWGRVVGRAWEHISGIASCPPLLLLCPSLVLLSFSSPPLVLLLSSSCLVLLLSSFCPFLVLLFLSSYPKRFLDQSQSREQAVTRAPNVDKSCHEQRKQVPDCPSRRPSFTPHIHGLLLPSPNWQPSLVDQQMEQNL